MNYESSFTLFRKLSIILVLSFILASCTASGLADESDGDLYTFCPYMSTFRYNALLKSMLDLTDTQASLLEVSSKGESDGNLIYTNILGDPIFIFGGATNEFDTAVTAYIHCSLEDSSTLKNIPMLVWAGIIQLEYFGEIEETGESFLEWVNTERKDGDTFSSPYFYATYNETPRESSSLLLIKF